MSKNKGLKSLLIISGISDKKLQNNILKLSNYSIDEFFENNRNWSSNGLNIEQVKKILNLKKNFENGLAYKDEKEILEKNFPVMTETTYLRYFLNSFGISDDILSNVGFLMKPKKIFSITIKTMLGSFFICWLMLPFEMTLSGFLGAVLGFYSSFFYILPSLNALMILNLQNLMIDELKKEENLSEEQKYINALNKLNLNKNFSNKLIIDARKNYLLAFHPDKINGDLNLQKELTLLFTFFNTD